MAKIFKKPTSYNKGQTQTIGNRTITVWKERTFTSYGAKSSDSYRVAVTDRKTGNNIFRTDDASWKHISEQAENQYKYGEKIQKTINEYKDSYRRTQEQIAEAFATNNKVMYESANSQANNIKAILNDYGVTDREINAITSTASSRGIGSTTVSRT